MTTKTLIIAFGHHTETDSADSEAGRPGYRLSDVARARCDEAVRVFQELLGENVKLLGTGTFGDFNTGDTPHGFHLKEYLIQKGIPASAISGWTATCHTLEDAFAARKVFVDGGFNRLIAVTDEAHMPRVRFIVARVFPDQNVVFREASLPPNADIGDENYKFKRARREWVDPPRYETSGCFPTEVYENADHEHKHYDTLSYGVVTAIFVVSLFPFVTDPIVLLNEYTWLLFVSAGLLNLVLLSIYLRMANWARRARRLLYYTEVAWGLRGFSSNDPNKPQPPAWFKKCGTVKSLVTGVTFVLSLALWVCALVVFLK